MLKQLWIDMRVRLAAMFGRRALRERADEEVQFHLSMMEERTIESGAELGPNATPGAAVIDLGCGPGFPITEVLAAERLSTFGVDAAPSFVQAFRRNLPNIPVACEAVQDSRFFDRTFDGVLAWGLIFLLSPEDQRRLIERIAGILVPGGRLLFTSPAEPIVWNDAMTGLESRSLGAYEYRLHVSAVGLSVTSEFEDEGQNHYFDAFKDPHLANPGRRDPGK